MSADFDREKVMERVRKMMRLANDPAAAEGERDNALRMAHATLAKYNLTMAEATKAQSDTDTLRGRGGEKRESQAMEGRDYPWMRTTAHAVGKLFFCEYFYILMGGGKVKHYFVGLESNVTTAQEMTKFVIASIDREGAQRAKAMGAGGGWWRSFCKGAAAKVWSRCSRIREDAERAPATPGTALVLASFYEQEHKANERFIAECMNLKLRTAKTTQRNTQYDAFRSGAEFGDRINLNRQIGGNSGGSNPRLK